MRLEYAYDGMSFDNDFTFSEKNIALLNQKLITWILIRINLLKKYILHLEEKLTGDNILFQSTKIITISIT